jgi:hypothetical protein
MGRRIEDEFTYLPISRQRRYQLRLRRDNRCTECGKPAVGSSRCLEHLVKAREWQRKKLGLKRRYLGTLGYQQQPKTPGWSAPARNAAGVRGKKVLAAAIER